MKFVSLDGICRSVLLKQQRSIHYYLEYLKHATDCFRELHFDSLMVVNTVILTLNDQNAATLPDDYVDYISVGAARGQFVQPFVSRKGMNRLTKYLNGEPTTYGLTDALSDDFLTDYIYTSYYFTDTFKIVPERGVGEIQFNEGLSASEIVLEYMSDGTYTDAATRVNPLAQMTIETFIEWASDRLQSGDKDSPKARKFGAEWRKLRARLNTLTLNDLRRTIHRTYTRSPKN